MGEEKFEAFSFINSVKDLEKCIIVDLDVEKNSIIVDTNFLFVTFDTSIDFIYEIERLFGKTYSLYVYNSTLLELEELSKRTAKNKKYLPLIAKMLRVYNFKVIESKGKYADDLIVQNLNKNSIIATNDKELRKKIWAKRSRVVYMRNKAYFECN